MKRTNVLAEIQSNIKNLSDTQLADVADYIEMILGVPDNTDFENQDQFDEDDYGYLTSDEGMYKEDL